MKILRTLLLITISLFVANTAFAQRFLWSVDFDYQFNNKEYANSALAESVTYYGARLTPQVGLGWESGNALMVGVDLLNDFGTGISDISTEMVVYYRYKNAKTGVYAGRFPRRNMIGVYSNAFFSDYISYYDSNLDGFLFNYQAKRGYVEVAFDWNSMLADNVREKFMIFSAGRLDVGPAYGGYNVSMYHHAGSKTVSGVVDNILIYPFLGVDFTKFAPRFSNLYFQVGWLQTFQNDRAYVDKFVTPGGVQFEARVERWGFGIYNTLYLGGNLMPYYASTVTGQPDYGNGLYPGDPFYRTNKGIYNRLELYWQRDFKSNISLKISSVHHYDGQSWGWQQLAELQIYLFQDMFKRIK